MHALESTWAHRAGHVAIAVVVTVAIRSGLFGGHTAGSVVVGLTAGAASALAAERIGGEATSG